MERVTIRVPKQRIDDVEQLVDDGEFPNRSEAIRSAIRDLVDDHEDQGPNDPARRPWYTDDAGRGRS